MIRVFGDVGPVGLHIRCGEEGLVVFGCGSVGLDYMVWDFMDSLTKGDLFPSIGPL